VLNDEWVSHPTWASEESGFVAHKKNTYEEALHKSEEERHEYQVHLDSLVRTISIFEPLNARAEEMTNEERNSWRLKADFGGPSKWIYHKTIKKIYGRDSGTEVIQVLQDCPGVAVPVVLSRLKQKEEDWRRAMREWGRMWKEVDAKNFHKSLDHQGLVFKSNDKKGITAKHFVNDVETVKLDQREKLEAELDGEGERGARRSRSRHAKGRRSRRDRQQRKRAQAVFKSVGSQLDYSFADTSVLRDSLKLVYSYLDHSSTQYSPQERRSVEKFLQSFIPTFCCLSIAEFGHGFEPMDEDLPSGPLSSGGEGRTVGEVFQQEAGDSRPSLNKKTSTDEEPAPSLPENKQPAKVPPCERWIRESVQSGAGGQEAGKTVISRRPFFGNTTFYALLRLVQVCIGDHVIDRTASDNISSYCTLG
jgi:paired amphipathic helix protein Sin3a